MSIRNRLLSWTGWLATTVGLIQWVTIVPFWWTRDAYRSAVVLKSSQLTLVTILMSLILLLIGYLFRHPRDDWMGWLWIPILLYTAVGVWRIILVDHLGWGLSDDVMATVEGWVVGAQIFSGWPIWLLCVLGFYFLPPVLPEESERIESSRGQLSFIWLIIIVAIVSCVMALAGSPLAFVDGASLFGVVVPIPFVLFLSGMNVSEFPSFVAGMVSLKFVPVDRLSDYRYFSRRAGRFVVIMGAFMALIGLVLLLGNLDSPEMLGPSMAVSLVSLVYGLGLKAFLFDPYCSVLRVVEEEISTNG